MIQSERIRLRRFTEVEGKSDLGNMVELESDADVVRYTPMRVPQTAAQTQARLSKQIAESKSQEPLGIWAAEMKKSQDFVGWFMLMKFSSERPELGFMLVRRHWAKGLATEIGSAIIRAALNNFGVEKIDSAADTANVASIAVLHKLGFDFQGNEKKFDPVLKRDVELSVFQLSAKQLK